MGEGGQKGTAEEVGKEGIKHSGAPEGWCAGEESSFGEKLGQGDSKMGEPMSNHTY